MSTLIRRVARYDFKSGHLADFHRVQILDEWLVENGRWGLRQKQQSRFTCRLVLHRELCKG
jgi:hypothetical protein